MGHNTNEPTDATAGSEARRRAATAQHERAIGAINAVFDRVAELSAARERLTALAGQPGEPDPLRDAESLLHAAEQVAAALDAVRRAATAAAEHRSRGELAADIGTRPASLFPRTGDRSGTRRASPTIATNPATTAPAGDPSPARVADESS